MSNVIWEKETDRCVVSIVSTSNWKSGIPKDPNIRKWLVKLRDKYLHDEYVPTDDEFKFVISTMDKETIKIIREAFEMKEKHNKPNLKNPEDRKIERIFGECKP